MWTFIQDQILGMKWLSALIGNLLNVLGLNNPPTRGQYSFEWLEVSDLGYSQISDIRNIKVRFVQTNLLIEEFNILENVSMALGYRGVGS